MARSQINLGALNLNHLRLIEALARSSSLGEAAEQIGLSQSAASHALARLRNELQDPIFIHTSQGMRPTPYGAQLAARIHDALRNLHDGLNSQVDFIPKSSNRTFNVALSDIGQILYLPGLLAKLAEEAPGVNLRVHAAPLKAPHALLESGAVDLALGTFTRVIVGCRQKLLYRERYVCVVRRDHPEFEQGMTAEAFHRVRHALVDPRGYVHEKLDSWLAEQGASRTAKLYVPYLLSLPLVIAQTDLMAIMASKVAERFATMIPLKVMVPPINLPAYDVRVFWHERFENDPANRWLRAICVRLFKAPS